MADHAAAPDPRRNAWREDLAAEALRGVVNAPRYAVGVPHQVIAPAAPVRHAPRGDAALDTEALAGEIVTVFDAAEGWAWAQLARDLYVGYLPSEALSVQITPTTHRVCVPATFVFPAADIKTQPLAHLSLGAGVSVVATGERFSRIASGGFIFNDHIAPRDRHAADFVGVAENFLGTPYLWGGKTRLGLDCSGLVQISLQAAGIEAPRDSDMQAVELGIALAIGENLAGLRRGDLVCWKGHIGIMTDAETLLHANAHHMAVEREPLAEAIARIAAGGSRPVGVRRLSNPSSKVGLDTSDLEGRSV